MKQEKDTAVNEMPDVESSTELHTTETGEVYNKMSRRRVDFIAKILCVLVAFAIWLYVMSMDSPTYEKEFAEIPVSIENISQQSGLSVISGYDSTIDITLVGKKSDILKLDKSDINAYVDASSVSEAGSVTLPVSIELPGGIRESDKNPGSIRVYFDEKSSVKVPVEVVLTEFSLEDGYELGEPVPSVNEITVSGPAAQLGDIDCARVTVSALGRITDSLTANGTFELIDTQGDPVTSPYIKMQTKTTTINIPVYVTKEIPITVAYKYGYFTDENTQVSISPASVLVRGESSALSAVNEILLTTIDEKKVSEGVKYNQQINLPAGLESVYGLQYAQVSFEFNNVATKELVIEDFSILNPNGLTYELVDETLTVTLRGDPQYISYISAASVTAEIDLSGISNATGNMTRPVNITLGSMFRTRLYEIGEYSIMVKIS